MFRNPLWVVVCLVACAGIGEARAGVRELFPSSSYDTATFVGNSSCNLCFGYFCGGVAYSYDAGEAAHKGCLKAAEDYGVLNCQQSGYDNCIVLGSTMTEPGNCSGNVTWSAKAEATVLGVRLKQ